MLLIIQVTILSGTVHKEELMVLQPLLLILKIKDILMDMMKLFFLI